MDGAAIIGTDVHVIGADHRSARASVASALMLGADRASGLMAAAADRVPGIEMAVVCTESGVEIIAAAPSRPYFGDLFADLVGPGFMRAWRSPGVHSHHHSGLAAVTWTLRLAAGRHSHAPRLAEISDHLADAWYLADHCGTLGPILGDLAGATGRISDLARDGAPAVPLDLVTRAALANVLEPTTSMALVVGIAPSAGDVVRELARLGFTVMVAGADDEVIGFAEHHDATPVARADVESAVALCDITFVCDASIPVDRDVAAAHVDLSQSVAMADPAGGRSPLLDAAIDAEVARLAATRLTVSSPAAGPGSVVPGVRQ